MENIFPLAFTKMNGTGNDFIVIDHRRGIIPAGRQPEFSRLVCRRMFSAGADGVILLEDSDTADFRWNFYNADGSVAEMCGNGARCAARFAFQQGIAGRSQRFETLAGVIEAEISEDDQVRIRMTEPFGLREEIVLVGGEEKEACYLNTGVPHVVVFVDDRETPVKELGREIRFHPLFQPEGANANFVCVLGEHTVLARTYERGVEDETRACGTGAVASAIIASIKKNVRPPVEVTTSGGERLIIEFTLRRDGSGADKVFLKGPARIVYTGELTAESLL